LSRHFSLKNLDLVDFVRRWFVQRSSLLRQIDSLKAERSQLQAKILALSHAKEQAERQAEERLREKEVLRLKIASQKKSSDASQRVIDQLNERILALRDELAKLKSR
jgi:seryl-tRNA synthetase